MKRITVEVSDELSSLIEQEQARRAVSKSEIVRDALETYLGARPPRRRIPFTTLGRSGRADISRRVDELLWVDENSTERAPRNAYPTTARHNDSSSGDTPTLQEANRGDAASPLVQRLDAIAARIARGRTFEDSTPAIRAAREGDTAML